MNKSDFVRAYADKLGVTIKEAGQCLDAFQEVIADVLAQGDYVHISGFATFELREKDARQGINPKTGEKVQIEACKSPVAKFSKIFKDNFNK